QFLITLVLVGELQGLDQIADVLVAVHAEQADAGGDRRLGRLGCRTLQCGQRLERALVAELPERQRRIILQRTLELGDAVDRVERELRLVIAERFDDGAAEEVLAARDLWDEGLSDARILGERGQRAN